MNPQQPQWHEHRPMVPTFPVTPPPMTDEQKKARKRENRLWLLAIPVIIAVFLILAVSGAIPSL